MTLRLSLGFIIIIITFRLKLNLDIKEFDTLDESSYQTSIKIY